MSSKKERMWEILSELLEMIPAPHKLMITAFLPQFRASFENLPESDLDSLIEKVRVKLDYIEGGGDCAEPFND